MKYLKILPAILFISCQINDGWTELFNGTNTQGWHIYGGGENLNGWYVENGVLAFDPELRTDASTSNLITNQQYTDFELSVEWMISEKGNSGIFWGVVEDSKYEHPYQTGPEVQILDDNWTEYLNERGDIQRTGSIFAIVAPKAKVSKPAYEWNHFLVHIDQTNNEGWIHLNGTEITRFPVNGPEWRKLVDATHFKDWEDFGQAPSGHIGLQDHGSQVAFRNIKIRELNR